MTHGTAPGVPPAAGDRGTPRAARAGQTVRLHPQTVRLTVRLSLTWGFAGQRPRLPGRADGACHLPASAGLPGYPWAGSRRSRAPPRRGSG